MNSEGWQVQQEGAFPTELLSAAEEAMERIRSCHEVVACPKC